MRLASSCAILVLALAMCQALPTKVSETKSLLDGEELKSNIDSGDEKDRSKKSASFCVEIRPGSEQAQPAQSAQMVVEPQTYSVIQQAPQPIQQTFSVVPAPQPMNVIQAAQPIAAQPCGCVPASQPTASNLILPAQQPVQPVHTLHIMQPAAQPCAPPSYNIVQSQPAPQPVPPTLNIIQPAPQPEPELAPEPVPAPPAPKPERIIEIVKPEPEHPKPTQVVNIIQPAQPAPEPHTETVNFVPMEPECEEQVVVMQKPVVLVAEEPRPMAAVVQVPRPCHHQQHALVTECNCHPKNVVLKTDSGMGQMHALTLKERSMGPLFRSQQRMMDQRAMQPLMISGSGSARSPMMLLNRSIRSDEESKRE